MLGRPSGSAGQEERDVTLRGGSVNSGCTQRAAWTCRLLPWARRGCLSRAVLTCPAGALGNAEVLGRATMGAGEDGSAGARSHALGSARSRGRPKSMRQAPHLWKKPLSRHLCMSLRDLPRLAGSSRGGNWRAARTPQRQIENCSRGKELQREGKDLELQRPRRIRPDVLLRRLRLGYATSLYGFR